MHGFTFVIQPNRLEIQSALLAISLREHFPDCELYAGVSEHDHVQWETYELMKELGVHWRSIEPLFDPSYKYANKMYTMKYALEHFDTDFVTFFDSDMICLDKFDYQGNWDLYMSIITMNRGDRAINNPNTWKKVYDLFGREVPPEDSTILITGEKTVPYYNAGFVGVRKSAAPHFGEKWLLYSKILHEQGRGIPMFKHLDQIALSVVATEYNALDLEERYNKHTTVRPLGNQQVFMAHYHHETSFFQQPRLRNFFTEALNKYPLVRSIIEGVKIDNMNKQTANIQRWKDAL
jgi:hypothetical protein